MHLIVYNCIRQLMVVSAKHANVAVRQVSFKGSVQAIRQWEPHLNQVKLNRSQRFELIDQLYSAISGKKIQDRPGRQEPRAVKRRPKPFQLMTAPRDQMREFQHRGKKRAKAA